MAIIRATVVLNKKSGIPKDASRNVWHFSADDTGSGTIGLVADGLKAFYQGIQSYLAPSVSAVANAHRVELAEVGFSSVSPILATSAFGTTTVNQSQTGMPNEVAVCLSFRADITGVPEESGLTRPRSRRRGRVYIGPLNINALEAEMTTMEPQVPVAVRELFLDSYDTAQTTWAGSVNNIKHSVLSRVDGTNRIVTQVSVDNEFDTVRRRGQKPALRMSREVVAGTSPGARAGTDVALAT